MAEYQLLTAVPYWQIRLKRSRRVFQDGVLVVIYQESSRRRKALPMIEKVTGRSESLSES